MNTVARGRQFPWTFAGILLTYWCNARCPFCYVCCGPDATEWVDPLDAVRWWQELDEMARRLGKTVKIHLTGGEPFGKWPVLLEVAARAHEKGLTAGGGFQKVETNAYWATDAGIVQERLAALDRLGMQKLVVSTDPFHQMFVAPERVRTCVETARRVLGPQRVQARWLDWYDHMQDLRNVPPGQTYELFREAITQHRERLTGRAAAEVAPLLPGLPVDSYVGQACDRPILGSRHVHIDPYGNVLAGTCTGVLLGNARDRPLHAIWADLAELSNLHPLLSQLIEGGPHALLPYARPLGFEPRPAGYASKCHLCSHIRQFLYENQRFAGTLGPRECYDVS
jgi:hypothetical protein